MSKEESTTTAAGTATGVVRKKDTKERERVTIEAPTDQDGNEVDQRLDRYPEGSPAREGKATKPSGQGGATPHDGVAYQDQWPPNYAPDPEGKK